MTNPDKLELTRADCEAVISYIFWHCRTSPEGRGFKVWQKMFDFINEEDAEEREAEVADLGRPLFGEEFYT